MCTLIYLNYFVLKMKKKLLIWTIMSIVAITFVFIPPITNAEDSTPEVNWFEIMPKLEPEQIDKVNEAIDYIWNKGGEVWQRYDEKAKGLTTSEQIASWIMTRDTIMNYIVFIVQFLSQLWLLVWAWFIMYAWYKYMLSVFNGSKTPSSTLKNAIIWIIIVIFSYAIMRILTSIIWLT